MREYPKIETLYVRDEQTKKVDPTKLRCPEFGIVTSWSISEKIDGTNIRIGLDEQGHLQISGRTDAAQIPTPLLSHLMQTFPEEKLREKFPDGAGAVTLFGEGYGPKIQKGGGNYRATPSFRLFDVLYGRWWLERDGIVDVANAFGVRPVPSWLHSRPDFPTSHESLQKIIGQSLVALDDGGPGCQAEGIVARSVPLLLNRAGERVMWKLKFKDF